MYDPQHSGWRSTLESTYNSAQNELKLITPSGRQSVMLGNFRKIGYDASTGEYNLVAAEVQAMWFEKIYCDR
jgi:hypothetical protein